MIAVIFFLSLISTATGACAGDSDCSNGEKCISVSPGCNTPLVGECREVKPWCPRNFAPVCSCGGDTYPNECAAIVAGERVAYNGECGSSQERLGTQINATIEVPRSPSEDKKSNSNDTKMDENDYPNQTADASLNGADADANSAANSSNGEDKSMNSSNESVNNLSGSDAMMASDSFVTEGGECDSAQSQCGSSLYCKFEPGSCGAVVVTTDDEGAAGASRWVRALRAARRAVALLDAVAQSQATDGRRVLRAVSGVCAKMPLGCPRNYHPVCGCDGKTYSNECVAAGSGVNVASDGECVVVMTKLNMEAGGGGVAVPCSPRNATSVCSATQFCSYNDGTCPAKEGPRPAVINDESSGGVCTEKPLACTKDYVPVCGCDLRTHGNECEAAAAGVNVKHRGPCPVPVFRGPCRSPADCVAGQVCIAADGFCDLDPRSSKPIEMRSAVSAGLAGVGGSGLLGECVSLPIVCGDVGIGGDVCGCDGKSYASQCAAHSAGVTVKHVGVCLTEQESINNGLPFSLPAIPTIPVPVIPSLNGIPLPLSGGAPTSKVNPTGPMGDPNPHWSVPVAITRLFDFVVWAEEANVYAYAAPLSAWYSPRLPLKSTSTLHVPAGTFDELNRGVHVNVKYDAALDMLGGAGTSYIVDASLEQEACAAVDCSAAAMCSEVGDCTACLPCLGEAGDSPGSSDGSAASAVGVVCQTTTAASARACFAQRVCAGLLSPTASRCIIDGVAEPCPPCDSGSVNEPISSNSGSEIVLEDAAANDEVGDASDTSSRLLTGGGIVAGVIGMVVAIGMLIGLFTYRKQLLFRRRSAGGPSVEVYRAPHADHPPALYMGHDDVGAYDGWSHCASAPSVPLQGVKGVSNV